MSTHILFVDDEAPIRELLSVFFRKKGYTVSTAVNIREAKEQTEMNGFDLAILDINLAGENGLELLKLLKEKYVHMPVILFTGLNADEELLQRAKEAGADGLMRKSESLADLFAQVTKHLPNA
jgi:DNA-binding response OmpR family regulator